MVDKCNKKNGGEFRKDISTRFVDFQGNFSFDNIVMFIFKGDKIKGCPGENCIAVKALNASLKDDDYLVVKLWEYISKLNLSTYIKHPLSSFANIQRKL